MSGDKVSKRKGKNKRKEDAKEKRKSLKRSKYEGFRKNKDARIKKSQQGMDTGPEGDVTEYRSNEKKIDWFFKRRRR